MALSPLCVLEEGGPLWLSVLLHKVEAYKNGEEIICGEAGGSYVRCAGLWMLV